MSTSDYHLQQAKRLREMAAQCAGTRVSKDWLKAAEDYQKLADEDAKRTQANESPSTK
jgi:hypothetical protein